MQKRLLILLVTALPFFATAQTFDQWAATVGWDGVSHWSRYMITMPAYQGPNSLPVPRIGNGSLDSNFSFAATANLHFSKGDNTQNLLLYVNYPLVREVISLDAKWVPYEHYKMSAGVKARRHVFSHFYNDSQATGELHLNTNISILKKWQQHIRLALRIGYRLPCGSGFGAARYTDGPGYHFDLSFGKDIKGTSLQWIGMLGFYTWQIESDKHNQDDAFLLGTGLEWNRRMCKIQAYIAGYLGYLQGSGDKPVVVRAGIEKKIKRHSFLLNLQQGIHDFDYSSVEAGFKYVIRN
jgi:hypothetical protein